MPILVLLLSWRRDGHADRRVLGVYLLLTGSLRFAIEFVRINERVVGPLTIAHLASLAAVAAGVILLSTAFKRPTRGDGVDTSGSMRAS